MQNKVSQGKLDEINRRNIFMAKNGIRITAITEKYAEAVVDMTEDSLNMMGRAHGGLITTLADCAGGAMARADGRSYVTSSMNVQFISNVTEGRITARSELISRGRRLCNVRVKITALEGQKLLSEGVVTFYCIEA